MRLLQTICYKIKNIRAVIAVVEFLQSLVTTKSTTASRNINSKGVSYANAALTTPYQGKMSALRLFQTMNGKVSCKSIPSGDFLLNPGSDTSSTRNSASTGLREARSACIAPGVL